MRFWNKSTFSLASLILLLAFLTVPVLAHAPSRIGNRQAHSHPTLALTAIDNNNDGDKSDAGEAAVEAHNVHPEVVSITLIPDVTRIHGNHIVITADTDGSSTTPATGNGNNQFTLVIDFNVDVGTGLDALEVGNFVAALLNASNANLPSTEVEITNADITRVSGDDSKFEVQVTIDPDSDSSDNTDTDEAIPNGTADDELEKLYFRIQVSADAVRSLPVSIVDPNGVTSVTAEGSCNPASKVYDFVLVHALPESDTPTLAITHTPADGAELGTDGMVTFTFTWTDASGIPTTGEGAFTTEDITVTGGTKGTLSAPTTAGTGATMTTTYTLKVTPTTPHTDVIVSVAAESVTDAAPVPNGLATDVTETWTAPVQETVAPTLAITHTPADGTKIGDGMVTFTFTWTDTSGIPTTGEGAFTTDDITVTGGTEGDFTESSNLIYTLKVTPTTPYTDATVTVAAGSVTDTAYQPNALADAVTETWIAPVQETVAPTLAITHTPADGTEIGDGMVTFTFTWTDASGIPTTGEGAFNY